MAACRNSCNAPAATPTKPGDVVAFCAGWRTIERVGEGSMERTGRVRFCGEEPSHVRADLLSGAYHGGVGAYHGGVGAYHGGVGAYHGGVGAYHGGVGAAPARL
jgi:hypothetical protein